MLIEGIGTAILLFLILAVTDLRSSSPAANMAPFIVGLIVGALVGLIYARTRSVRRRALQIWLLVALALVLLALLLIPPLLYY